jgi:tripartite-type tricarboxylate transporter receptor subunit TctC
MRFALFLLGILIWTGAAAQSYPAKPVRVIVPFPPGQAADIFSRMVAERLAVKWGQGVAVENRAGGGGVPGMMAGKQAAADGYTLVVGTSGTLGVNPNIYASIPYDPLHFASAGPGTAQHMTGELFKFRAGIDLVHVPYKGSGPGMTDLIGGQVPLMFDSLASALPHIKSGRIKILALTTAQRVPQLPEVPTVAEAGYNGFSGVGWSGFVLPAGTPREIVDKVSADTQAVLREPETVQRIVERGGVPDPTTPQQYVEFIRAEVAKWGEVARIAKVKLD